MWVSVHVLYGVGNEGDMAQANDNHSQSLANMACDDDRNRDHGILSTMATLLVSMCTS